jgi:hypothetical protein
VAKTLLELINELSNKPPLELVSVASPGEPNVERICLKTNQRVALREYLVLVGFKLPEMTGAIPINDFCFWLGNDVLDPGCWILLYTGPGEKFFTKTRESNEPALVLHWGRTHTVFTSNGIVPCLLRIDMSSLQIGKSLPNQLPPVPPPPPWMK